LKTIILLALKEEAPSLGAYSNVFFTGVGKVNAASMTAMLIERHKPDRIINFGTAGGITVHSGLHQVSKFVQRDMICCELGSKPGQTPFESKYEIILNTGGNGLTCSTGDNFVTDSNLQIPADVVDMEAYAIAKVCQRNLVEFLCYKYISDGANEDSFAQWHELVATGEQSYIDTLRDLKVEIINQ
jgi:adenosylhomocysteine nucleosidase